VPSQTGGGAKPQGRHGQQIAGQPPPTLLYKGSPRALLGAQYEGEEPTFDPIQPGEYPMHITQSSMETTRDGRGRFLRLDMEVLEGPEAGRHLTERLNLENPNEKAVEIAQRTLRAIVFAVGLSSCNDSEQLHRRRMLVRVVVRERQDQPGAMTNEIAGYKQAGGAGCLVAPMSAPQLQPAAEASVIATPPWKR
jgi:hypothetical protein